MNRFRVKKGSGGVRKGLAEPGPALGQGSRPRRIPPAQGAPTREFTLYASHSVWQSRPAFEAWTRSAEFRAAHKDAGQNKPLYIGHPELEGFEVRQTVRRGATAVA
jgi:Antibiotic biosynthesis monooxygenase